MLRALFESSNNQIKLVLTLKAIQFHFKVWLLNIVYGESAFVAVVVLRMSMIIVFMCGNCYVSIYRPFDLIQLVQINYVCALYGFLICVDLFGDRYWLLDVLRPDGRCRLNYLHCLQHTDRLTGLL